MKVTVLPKLCFRANEMTHQVKLLIAKPGILSPISQDSDSGRNELIPASSPLTSISVQSHHPTHTHTVIQIPLKTLQTQSRSRGTAGICPCIGRSMGLEEIEACRM